jgi:hypothetical protein
MSVTTAQPRSFFAGELFRNLFARVRAISWLTVLHVGLILSLSIAFRVIEVDHIPGVNGDEALDAVQIRDTLAGRPAVLKMPTGRLLSPIYGALLMVTDALQKPSFLALRSSAVIAGILLVFATLFLFWKSLGATGATLLTLLVATSPVNIAYSRVAIEQTLMVPAGMALVYFVWKRSGWGIFWAFIAALLVHPINVFLASLVLCSVGAWVLSHPRWTRHTKAMIFLAALTVLYVGVLFEIMVLPSNYSKFLDPKFLFDRFTSVPNFLFFLKYFIRLVTGLSSIEQYASPLPHWLARTLDIAGAAGLFALVVAGSRKAYRARDFRVLGIISGWFALCFGYYFVTGRAAIDPGVARYALVLLFPTHFVIVLCLRAVMSGLKPSWQVSLVSILAWAFLIQFHFAYFRSIQEKNSTAFRAYFTGERDPKETAVKFIRWDVTRRGKDMSQAIIVAEDWWTYWPLRYLLNQETGTKVLGYEMQVTDTTLLRDLLLAGGYLVGFTGSGDFEAILPTLVPKERLERFFVNGYGNQSLLSVWRIK